MFSPVTGTPWLCAYSCAQGIVWCAHGHRWVCLSWQMSSLLIFVECEWDRSLCWKRERQEIALLCGNKSIYWNMNLLTNNLPGAQLAKLERCFKSFSFILALCFPLSSLNRLPRLFYRRHGQIQRQGQGEAEGKMRLKHKLFNELRNWSLVKLISLRWLSSGSAPCFVTFFWKYLALLSQSFSTQSCTSFT